MSRVYWHTRDEGEAELLGTERAWMGLMTSNIATTFIPKFARDDIPGMDRIDRSFFRASTYDDTTRYYLDEQRLINALRSGFAADGIINDENGRPLSSFALLLNTTLRVGNDPVCLMTRIHAQCELNAYVEGPNRMWLADLIDQGRELGVMRSGAGWEALAELLRARDDAPVVSSYSVCDGFPGSYVKYDEETGEELNEATWEERWERGMAELRSRPDCALELSPENLRTPFEHSRHLIEFFNSSSGHGSAAEALEDET